MRPRRTLCQTLPLFIGLSWGLAAAAAETTDPAAFAPADALFFAGTPDPVSVWEEVKKGTGYRALQDEKLRQSAVEMMIVARLTEKFQQRLSTMLEIPADKIENPFGGPMALYLTGEAPDRDPDLVFIGTVTKSAIFDQYFETAAKKLRTAATDVETVEAGPYQILVFKNAKTKPEANSNGAEADGAEDDFSVEPSADPAERLAEAEKMFDELFDPENLPEEFAVCRAEGRLYLGNRADALRTALRVTEDESVAAAEDYRTGMRLLEPFGPVRIFVNVPRLMELARKADGPDGEFAKSYQAQGLDALRSFVGHMRLNVEGTESIFDGFLLLAGERNGAIEMMCLENSPTAPEAIVGDQNLLYGRLNLDPPKLTDQVERILRQSDPESADQMRAALEQVDLGPEIGKVNLRKDLIDQLAPPLSMGLDLRPPYQMADARLALGLGLRNREPVVGLLSRIPMFTQREVRGTNIFTFMMAPVLIAPTSGKLWLGSAAGIETALAGESAAALADSATFRGLAKHCPAETSAMAFVNTGKLYEALLEIDESTANPMDPAAQLVIGLRDAMLGEIVSDKDAAKRLIRYQGPSLMTMSTTSDGIRFTMVQGSPTDSR